jgi:FHA domain
MASIRICTACGLHLSGTRRELAEASTCPQCGGPLGITVDEAAASALTQVDEEPTAEIPVATSDPSICTYALVGSGSSSITLVRPTGFVGRAQASCRDLLADTLTVSRHQFSYQYRADGGIELTNMSQFGTTVNRHRLRSAESTTVQVGQTVEFGGLIFVLQER